MKWVLGISILLLISGCVDSNLPQNQENPATPFLHDTIDTPEKVSLGEKLFFEKRLSKNQNIACASCHIPEFAFSDTVSFSLGTDGESGFRNSPSIINLASKKLFHKDGGVRTLELQALSPIIDSNEMEGDFLRILEFLSNDSEYVRLFARAFDTVPTVFGLTRAIAAFERSLVFTNSAFDRFMEGDSGAFTYSQKNGWKLFSSERLNCISCHSGRMLTNYSYENIGLEHQQNDSGRARITLLPEDEGKFEVPTLRNVVLTGPYMHNGSFATLEEVIRYLEHGGGNHPNKSKIMHPFTLTTQERQDVLHFLESLTDSAFLKN